MELSLKVERYRGKPWPLGEGVVFSDRGGSIGRSTENFLVLPDPSRQISGRHACILLRGQDFFIVDTGQNGVFLNGSGEALGWCRTAKLGHGDTITIGEYLLSVDIRESAQEATGPAADDDFDAETILLRKTDARLTATAGTLPAAAPGDAESAADQTPAASEEGSSADVLVVDDDEDVIYLVKFMLERAGYTVMLAHDGFAASQILETVPPTRLVVLDVMLPQLDGFQLIDAIRGNDRWSQVPVIMLSGMTAERDIIRALNAGANDYVEKPFKPAELIARLRRFLS